MTNVEEGAAANARNGRAAKVDLSGLASMIERGEAGGGCLLYAKGRRSAYTGPSNQFLAGRVEIRFDV